jgi:hypothetical protein
MRESKKMNEMFRFQRCTSGYACRLWPHENTAHRWRCFQTWKFTPNSAFGKFVEAKSKQLSANAVYFHENKQPAI